MGFYSRYVVPRVVTCACGMKPVLKQRQKVVPRARGKILEVGMGAGQNIPHYDPHAVDTVIGIDPCEVSWQMAQPRVRQAPSMCNLLPVVPSIFPLMISQWIRYCSPLHCVPFQILSWR